MNRVFIVGRLTKDPEVKYLQSGTPVADLTIAYNRSYRDKDGNWKDEPHYFTVIAYSKLAERVTQKLKKGDKVVVEGELRQERWEKEGEKREKVKILAGRITLLQSKANGEDIKTEGIDDEDVPF